MAQRDYDFVTGIETSALPTVSDAVDDSDSAPFSQIKALLALVGIAYKTVLTMSATDETNQYIEMPVKAISNSMNLVAIGKGAMTEGEDHDYILTTIGTNKTRITFKGDFTTGGLSPMAEGEKISVQCFV